MKTWRKIEIRYAPASNFYARREVSCTPCTFDKKVQQFEAPAIVVLTVRTAHLSVNQTEMVNFPPIG